MTDKPTMDKGRDMTLDEKMKLLQQLAPEAVYFLETWIDRRLAQLISENGDV